MNAGGAQIPLDDYGIVPPRQVVNVLEANGVYRPRESVLGVEFPDFFDNRSKPTLSCAEISFDSCGPFLECPLTLRLARFRTIRRSNRGGRIQILHAVLQLPPKSRNKLLQILKIGEEF